MALEDEAQHVQMATGVKLKDTKMLGANEKDLEIGKENDRNITKLN